MMPDKIDMSVLPEPAKEIAEWLEKYNYDSHARLEIEGDALLVWELLWLCRALAIAMGGMDKALEALAVYTPGRRAVDLQEDMKAAQQELWKARKRIKEMGGEDGATAC